MSSYTYFLVDITEHIATVSFNRSEKANALPGPAWDEMLQVFAQLDADPEVRVVILKGEGNHFSAGIDLSTLMNLHQFDNISCEGRKREAVRAFIFKLQDAITAIEKCRKPVLAAVQGACVGGAVDIITACDMRYCSADAYFAVKEIDLGLVADIGTLQRLPKIIQPGMAAELAYTGRRVGGQEAAAIGLCNRTYDTPEQLYAGVRALAATIAEKSPLSIRGTKEMLLYTRDHTVAESLNYMTAWNASMLLSNDLKEAFTAHIEKRLPVFEN